MEGNLMGPFISFSFHRGQHLPANYNLVEIVTLLFKVAKESFKIFLFLYKNNNFHRKSHEDKNNLQNL